VGKTFDSVRRMGGAAIPLSVLLVGLVVVHYRFLLGPGRWIPGDRIDAALIHYVLEHGYQWLRGAVVPAGFWNAAFFYPHPNSMAYSEIMLGLLPFYAIWRAVGVGPGGSYQLWFVSVSILNFLVLYLFLRRVMDVRKLAAALGAYLFAFGSPRVNQIRDSHPQQWAEFYVVLAVWFLIRFLQLETREPRRKAVLWLSLAGAAAALQLISGFYFGWFLCFALLAAFAASIVQRGLWSALFARARRFWPAFPVAAALFFGLAGPSMAHYRTAAHELNVHTFSARGLIMPTLGSWIYAGDTSLVYSWIKHFPLISRVNTFWERANGIGIATGVLMLAGAILWRRHPVVRIMTRATVVVLAVTFTIPGGWTLWSLLCLHIPGAIALRAVSRWGVFLLFPWGVAVACCLDQIQRSRRWPVVIGLGIVVILEQVIQIRHYDFQSFEREALSYTRQLKPECNCFLVSPALSERVDRLAVQVAAMWAQVISGVPTMNGHSGATPPGYSLDAGVATSLNYLRTVEGISEWQERYPGTRLRLCWLRPDSAPLPAPGAPLRMEVVTPAALSPMQEFIYWSYLGILGRWPAPDEMSSAEAVLNSAKTSRVRWILDLIRRPESVRRVFVEEIYLALLGRDADSSGWWHWSAELAAGHVTKEDVAAGILRSAEYRRHCAVLPASACLTAADAAGVVRQVESPEFEKREGSRLTVGLMYLRLLGRPPDAAGAAGWMRQLDSGATEASLVAGVLGSREYKALIGAQP